MECSCRIHVISFSTAMKRRGLILARIETLKKVKFPTFIKKNLIESAFDSAALKTIRKETVNCRTPNMLIKVAI